MDGFNLYFRLKKTPYKWLNLKSLIKSFSFQDCHISKIRYFTARVIDQPDDPSIESRQHMYLRALKTIPEVEIHFGQFKRRTVYGQLLEKDNPLYKKKVKISKFEEKGSDVNIATFMIADCFQNKCDVPVLLSNDSDLSEPLKFIKTVLKKPIGLVTPTSSFVTELKRYSSFRRKISEEGFKSSQFSQTLKDRAGTFSCPKKWQ